MNHLNIEVITTICAKLKFRPVLLYNSDNGMPDQICRTCGEELVGFSQCFECKRPIQQICIKCGKRTIERFHSRCFTQTRHNLISASVALVE